MLSVRPTAGTSSGCTPVLRRPSSLSRPGLPIRMLSTCCFAFVRRRCSTISRGWHRLLLFLASPLAFNLFSFVHSNPFCLPAQTDKYLTSLVDSGSTCLRRRAEWAWWGCWAFAESLMWLVVAMWLSFTNRVGGAAEMTFAICHVGCQRLWQSFDMSLAHASSV